MISIKDKKIRTLILVMSVLVAIGILISRGYYRSVNSSFDPRAVPAKQLYAKYNSMAQMNDFEGVFLLLDSIESIYNTYPHYATSYEMGVLYNNRAAALIIMGMHKDSLTINSVYHSRLSSDSLLALAEQALLKSISIYQNWQEKYDAVDEQQMKELLKSDFSIGLDEYSAEELAKFEDSRLDELVMAQSEIERRLSVSFTNLGIVYRTQGKYELAVEQYKTAIDLWDRNLDAQNNLNILMGRPLVKQNIIQKLFPPKKEESTKK